MSLGPFLNRLMVTSARRSSTFADRALMAAVVTAMVAGTVVVWDWWAWDRASVSGAARCALAAFAAVAATLVLLGLGAVLGEVSPGVALERDRKTLDALLATRLSSAEIVLGILAAGLFKSLFCLSAVLPLLVLLVYLGGVDPRLMALACGGLLTTLLTMGALALAASVAARTAEHALSMAVGLISAWLILPLVLMFVLPRVWPAGARWVIPAALWMLDSSPLGVVANLVGLVRRSSFLGSMLRMIALQAAGTAVLIAWSVWLLRPVSRAIHDGADRAALARMLRRRRRSRPACGDDPVLWNEIHSTRHHPVDWLILHVIGVVGIALLAYLTSWFAVPAFAELAERGYRATPGNLALPELHPLARMMVVKLSNSSLGLAPGQARLEFNIMLRQASTMLMMFYVLTLTGCAAESIAAEKQRDTWLGLIATPLSGWEILRAKMLGVVWRMRVLALVLVALWTVALLAGALHPLGFLAALLLLGSTAWLFTALGTYVSLWSKDTKQATSRVLLPWIFALSGFALMLLPAGFSSVLMGTGSACFLSWASLLSYDDVAAVVHNRMFAQLATVRISTGESARRVLAALVIGLAAHMAIAALLTRAVCRGFDRAAGRPQRPARRQSSPDAFTAQAST